MGLFDRIRNSGKSTSGKGILVTSKAVPIATSPVPGDTPFTPEPDPKEELRLDRDPNSWKEREIDEDFLLEERRVTSFVNKQFEFSHRSRKEMELEWAMALAYFEGRDWLLPDTKTMRLIRMQNEKESERYISVHKMRALIDGSVGMATQSAPDARAIPMTTTAERDILAAEEANRIASHYSRVFDRETQTKERVRWAMITGTAFVKTWYDKNKDQFVPLFDYSTGQVTGVEQMQIGGLRQDVLTAFDVYLDPTAKTWKDVRWLIHASVRPLSWFVDNYGNVGKRVQPDAAFGNNGYVDAYLEGGQNHGWIPASSARSGEQDLRRDAAVVFEYWELPSVSNEMEGRLIICTRDRLIYNGPWPYEKRDAFPFTPIRWNPRAGTPYGHSLGFDLCPLVLSYNRLFTKMVEQAEGQKDYVFVERLSNIGPDAFTRNSTDIDDTNRIYRKIYYNKGASPPSMNRAPGISSELFNMLELINNDMMDIAGLHDVSQGQAAAGTPAESVKLLQRADNTQHSFIRADIEISAAAIKEWEIALTVQYATVPFIGSVDDQMNPVETPNQGMVSFDAIKDGGQFRVVYVPGSTQEDSPDQKMQKILMMREMGLFGDPADPETNALVVKMLQLPETPEILRHLGAQAEKMAMMQQQEMEMQAAQAQGPPAFNPEEESARAQIDLEKQQALQASKDESEMAKMQMEKERSDEEMLNQLLADIVRQNMSPKGANSPENGQAVV